MKIHKINFSEEAFKRPEHLKPPVKAADFFLKATMVCPDCDFEQDVLINKDREVYHECNEGNRRAIVPELKMPVPEEPKPTPVKVIAIGAPSKGTKMELEYVKKLQNKRIGK